MPFKVKNSQLSNETLGVLNQLIDLDINATAAFKLTRIIKHISSIVEDKLKSEKRIYDKWVLRDEDGNPVVPKDEEGNLIPGSVSISDINEFTKEMTELLEVENDIPFEKINFEDLDLKTAKIKDLIKVEFLFS
jgi:hypothetical protein